MILLLFFQFLALNYQMNRDDELVREQAQENEEKVSEIQTWQDIVRYIRENYQQSKNLSQELIKQLQNESYFEPAAIQKMVVPTLLHEYQTERFNYIKSPTGTGKTLAFILPQLVFFEEHYLKNFFQDEEGNIDYRPYSLIIVSQHALLSQIKDDFNRVVPKSLSDKGFIVQHLDKNEKAENLKGHVLCGVPETILKFISDRTLNLQNVRFIVVDEADNTIMNDDNKRVLQIIQKFIDQQVMKWKIIVCGATIDFPVLRNAFVSFLRSPQKTQLATQNKEFFDFKYFQFGHQLDNIKHFYDNRSRTYDEMLKNMVEVIKVTLDHFEQSQIMVFFNSKVELNVIKDKLSQEKLLNYLVDKDKICEVQQTMDREKQKRQIDEFREGAKTLMICSDLMSRGMNFRKVRLVINFGIPRQTPQGRFDAKRYDQRVGRTGRMEDLGVALTIYNPELVPSDLTDPENKLEEWLQKNGGQIKPYDRANFLNELSHVYTKTNDLEEQRKQKQTLRQDQPRQRQQ